MKYIFTYKLRPILDILHYIQRIYQQNSKSDDKHFDLCAKYSKLTDSILKLTIAAYGGAAIFCTIPLVIELLLTDNLRPILHVYFVGVKVYSDQLMLLLNIYNIVMFVLALYCVIAIDTLIFVTFVNIPLISFVIEAEIEEFDAKVDERSLAKMGLKQNMIRMIELYGGYVEYDSR